MATEQNDTPLVVWNGESVPLTVKVLLEAPLRGDTFGAKLNLVMSFWNERSKLTVPAGATPFVPFDRANLTKAHVSTMLTLKADPNVKRGPFAVGQLNPGKLIEAVLKSPKVADADKLKLCGSSSTKVTKAWLAAYSDRPQPASETVAAIAAVEQESECPACREAFLTTPPKPHRPPGRRPTVRAGVTEPNG